MGRNHTTKDALLTYLRVDDQPVALYAVKRYMQTMMHCSSGAINTCLWRLCRAGVLERVAPRWYRALP